MPRMTWGEVEFVLLQRNQSYVGRLFSQQHTALWHFNNPNFSHHIALVPVPSSLQKVPLVSIVWRATAVPVAQLAFHLQYIFYLFIYFYISMFSLHLWRPNNDFKRNFPTFSGIIK